MTFLNVTVHRRLISVTAALCLVAGCADRALPKADPSTVDELATSPGGIIAAAFLEAYNSGDVETVREFMATYFSDELKAERSPEAFLVQYERLHGFMGPIVSERITRSGDHAVLLVARPETDLGDRWVEVTLVLSRTTPPMIDALPVAVLPSRLAGRVYTDWEELGDLLEQGRADLDLPALAAAWAVGGTVVEQAAIGVCEVGRGDEVSVESRFHIGSVSKSMTATMIGRLADQGLIDWQDTVGEVLADLEMRPEYKPVTLEQLLAHRGRIPRQVVLEAEQRARLKALAHTPSEQRAAFAAEVLRADPLAQGVQYSNAGYAVAALMAERRSGSTWETLIHEEVFRPLGMRSAGIGWPAAAERPDQPWGHFFEGGSYRPQPSGEVLVQAYLAPAGDVHCTVADMVRFGAIHLAGLSGRDGTVKSATIRRLHTPLQDGGESYAGGWSIDRAVDGAEMHLHNGSAGTFYALLAIFPEDDLVFALASNAGAEPVEPVAMKILEALRARWAERESEDTTGARSASL